ncbi:MAG: GH1 family beta-glucosidase [Acidimicrobiales bacterium]
MTTGEIEQGGATRSFPDGFLWGAATAAYQIEGAATEDGRTASIWDTFSHTPGKVRGGDNGDIACDSYHLYRDDVKLLAELGMGAYRFSVSWPRVQPGGTGAASQKGLDYYRALVDELCDNGITPLVTLYHWDLPQELEDAGGWTSRETAGRFADYASLVVAGLGDSVTRWITLNEPRVVADNGYRNGTHAPGRRDVAASVAATHHLLLGHGLAAQAVRAASPGPAEVGIALDPLPVRSTEKDMDEVIEAVETATNGLYLGPVLRGEYPACAPAKLLDSLGLVLAGDLSTIRQPLDFLGCNYYNPIYVRAGDWTQLRPTERPVMDLPDVVSYVPDSVDQTSMGWPIEPEVLYELLRRLQQETDGLPIYITENGCTAEDYVGPDGVVNDFERVQYLHAHLDACERALRDGVNLVAYFAWSLLDNFEWTWGFQKRFGIVFVDFHTQQRIPKQSARFLSSVARANVLPPLPG